MQTIARITATALILTGAPCIDAAQPSTPDLRAVCQTLDALSTPAWRVDTHDWVSATDTAPEHCLLQLTLGPRPSGVVDLTYGTGIELRLPAGWNGRLLFQGGGGLNGVLNPALGNISGAPSALMRGFAVVSTDGGHRGRSAVDARFGVDQQARLDFAYQAVARTTLEAKSLVTRAYGRKPEYTYFMGCSTGGREAMLAAQRLPMEFDGIVAGNPSYNLTRIALNQAFSLQAVTRVAPKDPTGKPDLSRAFTDAQLKGVADAVLARCDALDGLADGIVHDARACHFDPAGQICGKRGAPGPQACLSTAQADTLRTIFGGARNSRGESLYGDFPFDTGIASSAWRGMHLGATGGEPANAVLGRDTLRMFAMTPAQPDFDIRSFDFDRDVERTRETAAINDAVATLLGSFAGHGGKLILYQGLSDQAISPGSLTHWYGRITPRTSEGPQDWARLFPVPGMLHCAGGQATDQFDMLAAIQAWVEEGRAPDRILARGKAFPGRTRPLCPFPKVARYMGGDSEDERSFACR
jgi:feruloyl esterase